MYPSMSFCLFYLCILPLLPFIAMFAKKKKKHDIFTIFLNCFVLKRGSCVTQANPQTCYIAEDNLELLSLSPDVRDMHHYS